MCETSFMLRLFAPPGAGCSAPRCAARGDEAASRAAMQTKNLVAIRAPWKRARRTTHDAMADNGIFPNHGVASSVALRAWSARHSVNRRLAARGARLIAPGIALGAGKRN